MRGRPAAGSCPAGLGQPSSFAAGASRRDVCRKDLRHPNSFFDHPKRNQKQNAHIPKTLRIPPIRRTPPVEQALPRSCMQKAVRELSPAQTAVVRTDSVLVAVIQMGGQRSAKPNRLLPAAKKNGVSECLPAVPATKSGEGTSGSTTCVGPGRRRRGCPARAQLQAALITSGHRASGWPGTTPGSRRRRGMALRTKKPAAGSARIPGGFIFSSLVVDSLAEAKGSDSLLTQGCGHRFDLVSVAEEPEGNP